MTKVLAIFLILCSLFSPTKSYTQWTIQQLPTSQPLTDIYFADTVKGWVRGKDGLFHTTDGGLHWLLQAPNIGTISGLTSTEFWATGYNDTILHTTDGGTTFSRSSLLQYFDYDSLIYVSKVYFYDSLKGWVTGFGFKNKPFALTELINTTDGGYSWTQQYYDSSAPLSRWPLIQFINPNLGWLTSTYASELYGTTDGGNSWNMVTPVVSYYNNMDMQFVTDNVGWISSDEPVGATAVLKTIDSGKTWMPSISFLFSDVTTHHRFSDALNGWVVQTGSQTEIWHTCDGGAHWDLQYSYSPGFYFRANKVFALDRFHVWIVGENGMMLHTSNGGVTAVTDTWEAPTGFSLMQNYPNPFNPATNIGYQVPQNSRITIRIDDILGRPVKVLLDAQVPPGIGSVLWDGRDERSGMVGTGVYFCFMIVKTSEMKERTATRKIVLVR